jgi:hypothetical protein
MTQYTRFDKNTSRDYQLRDEINLPKYETETVGMALSGKDTGVSPSRRG